MSSPPPIPAETVLRSRSKTVTIGANRPFCVIGERINPTGRKKFAEELRAGELSTVTFDAVAQVEAGANMLDVNAGIPLVDEAELLKSMLHTVQTAVDAPICIIIWRIIPKRFSRSATSCSLCPEPLATRFRRPVS